MGKASLRPSLAQPPVVWAQPLSLFDGLLIAVLLGLQSRVEGVLHGCHKCSQFLLFCIARVVKSRWRHAALAGQTSSRLGESRQCGDPGPSPERFWIPSTAVDLKQRAPHRAAALLIFHGDCAGGPSSAVTAV